ncbi:MAG: hypothetical protein ACLFPO_02395 [Spirochaetaceae bacterium]
MNNGNERRPETLSRSRRRLRAALLSVAFLGLGLGVNVLIGVYAWLPTRTPAMILIPVPEVFALAALIFLWTALFGRRHRQISLALGLVAALVFAFAGGEAFFQAVYREHFSMWRNLRFLPDFLRMVTGVPALSRPALVVAAAALLIGALAGVFAILFHGLGCIAVRLRPKRSPVTVLVIIALVSGAAASALRLPDRPASVMLVSQLVAGPGAGGTAAAAETGDAPMDGAPGADMRAGGDAAPESEGDEGNEVAEGEDADSGPAYAFPELKDEDVRLFIIESYGHTLFTRSDHYELIAPVYDRLGRELDAAGFTAYSSFMKSPAFGGRSWLADATVLSGRWIGDQETYDSMWNTDTRTLVRIMEEAGYHTVLAAPGMTYLEEGFREFFPYDEIHLQGELGYRGKPYSFGGGITDQFLLNQVRLRREEAARARARAAETQLAGMASGPPGNTGTTEDTGAAVPGGEEPFFGVYVMVSSHVPFNVVPPFIEDWSEIGDGSIYNDLPRRVFDNDWLRGGEYPEGYTASIEYSLETVVDFLITFIEDDSLAVIIGDHQPRIPIAEQESTFSVPVHVISRNGELVRRFSDFDFEEGFEPSQPLPHPGMDELQPMLLEAFGGSAD